MELAGMLKNPVKIENFEVCIGKLFLTFESMMKFENGIFSIFEIVAMLF